MAKNQYSPEAYDFSLDAGHAQGKVALSLGNGTSYANWKDVHGYAELSQREYERHNPIFDDGFCRQFEVKIDGETRYFLLGSEGRNHMRHAERVRATRYKTDYISVQAIFYIFNRACQSGIIGDDNTTIDINLAIAYPAGDAEYRVELAQAIASIGKMRFKPACATKWMNIKVRYVFPYAETYGGFINATYLGSGRVNRESGIDNEQFKSYVFDIGGGTSELMVCQNYSPSGFTESIPMGINTIRNELAQALRQEFQDVYTQGVDLGVVDNALANGKVMQRGSIVDVSHIVDEVLDIFFIAIDARLGEFYDGYVIVTGGGYIVLRDRYDKRYSNYNIVTASSEIDTLDFANAWGGLKILTMKSNLPKQS